MIEQYAYTIRVNGRGNAWPVPLGESHPFYNRNNIEDLANASFSVIKKDSKNNNIQAEILIDAGHGVVQYLLKHHNRIPEAVFLTHPHIDHTLGIDWIIQSYYRKYKKKYPVFSSLLCWENTLKSFPHLESMVNHIELIYGVAKSLPFLPEVNVTAYPVYHGKYAYGASMFLFQFNENKLLFSGDIILPLIRKADINNLMSCDLFVVDANNRFPYPKSNHWSIVNAADLNYNKSFFNDWIETIKTTELINPHINPGSNQLISDYFNDWLSDQNSMQYYTSIFQFTELIKPNKVWLVHYSGSEDEKHHNSQRISSKELEEWTNNNKIPVLFNTNFNVPEVGSTFDFK